MPTAREMWDKSRMKAGEISDYSLGSKMMQFLRNLFGGSGDLVASSDLEEEGEDLTGTENSVGGEEYMKLLTPTQRKPLQSVEDMKNLTNELAAEALRQGYGDAVSIKKRIFDILTAKNKPNTKAIINEIVGEYKRLGKKPPDALIFYWGTQKNVPTEVLVRYYQDLLRKLGNK